MAKIAFLTRGDEQWGMGHLYRTSRLVQQMEAQRDIALYKRDMWDRTGGIIECEVRCLDSEPARRFWEQHEVIAPVSLHRSPEDAAREHADIFVIDWLASPAEFVRDIASRGSRVVLLDDNGPAQTEADLVINALITPLDASEQHVDGTRVLGGAAYVQLPPAVTKLRGVAQATTRAMATELAEPAQPSPAHAVLVSFGGSPRAELIALALASLADVGFSGRILVMPAPDSPLEVNSLDIELIPPGDNFHEVLAAVDIAILSGGLSLFEAAFLGVPSIAIAVDSIAPGYERHQLDTATRLTDAGCCFSVGLASEITGGSLTSAISRMLIDSNLRGRMSAAGMRLLDGHGLMRTATAILDLL